MPAGQSSGSGAMTELNDEKVRKNDILSNRDKAQRPPGRSLDSTGVQVDEYKDIPTNQRPDKDASSSDKASQEASRGEEQPSEDNAEEKVDRPGFDLGGASGDVSAGKGLGLDKDAKEGRKDWGLPR